MSETPATFHSVTDLDPKVPIIPTPEDIREGAIVKSILFEIRNAMLRGHASYHRSSSLPDVIIRAVVRNLRGRGWSCDVRKTPTVGSQLSDTLTTFLWSELKE